MQRVVLRALLSLFIPVFACYAQAGVIDESQSILNKLGYNAGSVDGIYGRKTENAISKFYSDNGESYDGILGAKELTDLQDALSKKRLREPQGSSAFAKYKRALPANGIEYDRDIKYSFRKGDFFVDIRENYSSHWRSIFSMDYKAEADPFTPTKEGIDCKKALLQNEPFQRATVNTATATPDSTIVMECWWPLRKEMHQQWVDNKPNSAVFKFFFEQLTPHVIKKNTWTYEPDIQGGQRDKAMERFFALYAQYSDFYQTTMDLDSAVLGYFNYHEQQQVVHPLPRKKYLHCPTDSLVLYPKFDDFIQDSCANWGAERALTRVMVGLKYQHDDILNEGIQIMKHIAESSHGAGATLDAYRGGDSVGYLMQLSTSLDPAAFIVSHYTDIDAYELGGGKFNNTVRDVLEYSFRSVMDPEMNYKYSSKNIYDHNGYYKRQIWREAPDVDFLIRLWVQAAAGFTSEARYLQRWYATNRNNTMEFMVYWNGMSLVESLK